MLFRDIPELERARIREWLLRGITPPKSPTDMTNGEIADVLQVMLEQGTLFDGISIWLAEAASRLRGVT